MTTKQIEAKLISLSQEYRTTRDPLVREQYRSLHAQWMRAKSIQQEGL